MGEWTVRLAEPRDRERLVEMETELFGPQVAGEWAWMFDRNPAGGGWPFVAVTDDGRLAGTRSLLPWDLQVNGDRIRVGQYARSWTYPEFRRRGASVAIGNAINRHAEAERLPLVFLFPSVRSIPGHRTIGNVLETVLQRRQCLLSPRFLWKGAPGALDAPLRGWRSFRSRGGGKRAGDWEPVDDGGEEADRLWPSLRNAPGVWGVRDGAFVSWRYSPASGRAFQVLRYPRGGPATTMAVIKESGHRVTLVDVWGEVDPGETPGAMAGLIEALAQRGAWFVDWAPPVRGPWSKLASRLGFVKRSKGVPLARWFPRPRSEIGDLASLEAYRLTEGDSDYA